MDQKQKTAAFEKIFYSTRERVYAFLKKRVRDQSQVEDSMQQCYLQFWEKFDTVDRDRDVLPLLLTYSRNAAIDNYRKNGRYVFDEDLLVREEDLPEMQVTQDAGEQRDAWAMLMEKVATMPARRKEVFELIRIKGLSYRQAAVHLQISVSTVEKHMHEAYKTLVSLRE